MLPAADAIPVNLVGAVNQVLVNGAGLLVGWDLIETGNFGATTALASATQTVNGASAGITSPIGNILNLTFVITAASGTTPTLTISIQWSDDATNWGDANPVDTFTQQTAAGAVQTMQFTVKAQYYRIKWTIGGTTPSFTFFVQTYTNTVPNVVNFWDGQTAAGYRIGVDGVAQTGTTKWFNSAPYVLFNNGLTAQNLGAGTVQGAVFVIPAWRVADEVWAYITRGDTSFRTHLDVDDLNRALTGGM